ncbi:DNA glycosylase [Morchella snyderi]|nr:DNA glycosylase [Morchella snyderi]
MPFSRILPKGCHVQQARNTVRDMQNSSAYPPEDMEWKKLPVPLSELRLSTVLRCGQSFRWKSSGNDEWSCALSGRILSLKQDPTHLYYRAIFPSSAVVKMEENNIKNEHGINDENGVIVDDTVELIRDYFNLSVNLTELYEKWSFRDPHFKKKAPAFMGIRVLRQDPWENLVSFICSSNNNISRIGQMVENLCITFGTLLGQLGETPYYDFPPPSKLTPASVEGKLRNLGFGYRARYIHQTAQIVATHGKDWLHGLRQVPYQEAHEALLELRGVGPKVADCVCLMSLDKKESVPVDTHVWQIAMRDYKFGKGKHKSLTKATYLAIGDHFRELWGEEAGWAHSVLFAADLRAFAVKEVKIKKTRTKVVKREVKDDDSESNSSGEDALSTNTSTTVRGVLRKLGVGVKNEVETAGGETERRVKPELRVQDKDGGGNGNITGTDINIDTDTEVKSEDNEVVDIDTDTMRRSRRRAKVKVKNEKQTDEIANTVTRSTRRKVKVEAKDEDDNDEEEAEQQEQKGKVIKKEKAIKKEKVVVKKEKAVVKKEKAIEKGKAITKGEIVEEADLSLKRVLKADDVQEELDIKSEDLGIGLTMADRIKRRRRH